MLDTWLGSTEHPDAPPCAAVHRPSSMALTPPSTSVRPGRDVAAVPAARVRPLHHTVRRRRGTVPRGAPAPLRRATCEFTSAPVASSNISGSECSLTHSLTGSRGTRVLERMRAGKYDGRPLWANAGGGVPPDRWSDEGQPAIAPRGPVRFGNSEAVLGLPEHGLAPVGLGANTLPA